MGLDTSHDCWHGAYSAFSRWRNKLAEVAGYSFFKAGEPPIYDTACLDWGCINNILGDDLLTGTWPRIPVRPDGTPDALIVLLAHSDCEGKIQADMCAPLADRLEQLLPLLEGDGGGHIGNYREKTQQFINGLRDAAANGEAVDFH
jgi:hypothetical protein